MKLKYIVFVLFTFLLVNKVAAQEERDSNLVQFSGMILDGSNEQLIPVPYTNIFIKEKGRGTYSDFSGFFSIVVEKGDKVEFSAVGYQTIEYTIPDSLNEKRYSIVQLMTQDTINLPEAIVFPWPSREHFKQEFLAMDVTQQMQQRAIENLASDALARMRSSVPTDGNESSDFYLRQQARTYYHIGQTPPMNIFSPVAWKQFFDAWKNGDYKKKKKKKKSKKTHDKIGF
ncbi:MAG TPA: carboxypeptidase-like regulatory domain-containing protein [Phaeodactylibacter sp.]|nr:carboxypeptidase-like regulatory domain-containing protein [Phaeodactylibacter sp.]